MQIQSILSLLKTFVTLGGSLWLVWGAVTLGIGLKSHTGPEIQSGIWQIAGGALVIAAAQLFLKIQV